MNSQLIDGRVELGFSLSNRRLILQILPYDSRRGRGGGWREGVIEIGIDYYDRY